MRHHLFFTMHPLKTTLLIVHEIQHEYDHFTLRSYVFFRNILLKHKNFTAIHDPI